MTDVQKARREAFANWLRTNFNEEQTLKFLVLDEKMFYLNGMYKAQNDRIWVVSRPDADKRGSLKQKRSLPQKAMVRLGAYLKVVTPLVILDKVTVHHERYIGDVLPVAHKYGSNVFGDDWTCQQDGAVSHAQALSK
jgi:hypothetical protein